MLTFLFLNIVLTCLDIITLTHILFLTEGNKKHILLYIEQDEEIERYIQGTRQFVSIKKQNKSFVDHFLNGDINYNRI